MPKRLFLFVMDSLGIGALPDAAEYGDEQSNTLAAVAASSRFYAPNLQSLGLFNIEGASGGAPDADPLGCFARMAVQSKGKDSVVGHWEIAGVVTREAMPTYPDGIPERLLDYLYADTVTRCIGNVRCSPEEALRRFGREHLRTGGRPILFTLEDSVVQLVAHEAMMPPNDLYNVAAALRGLMQWEHAVGRIIARPFTGDPPDGFEFLPGKRRDYALPPTHRSLFDALRTRWQEVITIGNIYDLFAGQGVTRTVRTKDNAEAMAQAAAFAEQFFPGLCMVNLSDFDVCAHRRDVDAYAKALSEFDRQLGYFVQQLGDEDVVILTADHGCDPSGPATNHSREYTPMLAFGHCLKQGVNLGTRTTLADIAATVQEFFDLPVETAGTSFLREILN